MYTTAVIYFIHLINKIKLMFKKRSLRTSLPGWPWHCRCLFVFVDVMTSSK